MKGVYSFVVKPKGERYNNKKLGDDQIQNNHSQNQLQENA